MACLPAPESQTPWFNQIESLKMEYKNTVDRHPDASDVMESVYVHLKDNVGLEGCTPASAGESSTWKQIVTKAADAKGTSTRSSKGNDYIAPFTEYAQRC
jgi:hypothetical protein